MSLRLSLLGIVWLVIMLLLFLTPIKEDAPTYFGAIPSRAFIHFFLFWGFTHIWIGALKKQLRMDSLRKHAFVIVFAISLLISIVAELIPYISGMEQFINYWNLFFGFIGTCIGIVSFRLLYSSCY